MQFLRQILTLMSSRGFTLVELAVVLVILALVAGSLIGISSGMIAAMLCKADNPLGPNCSKKGT